MVVIFIEIEDFFLSLVNKVCGDDIEFKWMDNLKRKWDISPTIFLEKRSELKDSLAFWCLHTSPDETNEQINIRLGMEK